MNSAQGESDFAVLPGAGGLPKVSLAAPDGAQAEVYLQGAHVTSWKPAGGEERLFLSATAEFRVGGSIRGGVPVAFPQFSERGPLPKHGFARRLPWEFLGAQSGTAAVTAKFRLRASDATRRLWPFAFETELSVRVGGPRLEMTLRVTNPGDQALSFTGAVHTYLRVAEAQTTVVEPLGGARYLDSVTNSEHIQAEPALTFGTETDRVYFNAPAKVMVREPSRVMEVAMAGFPDIVIWNPWTERGAALADLEPEGYRHMLCVEAAVVGTPVCVEPGAEWLGTQTLTAS